MSFFVDKDSIVRQIWGKSDTILFIFAGAAAEFAANKAVDWLYFTGRLPADPIGRLFSTVRYAKDIVFSEQDAALRAIDAMAAIHAAVEAKRGSQIPAWAYRDVLFMLIDYSIRSFEILERKLTDAEKAEVFRVFNSIGTRMGLQDLPGTLPDWQHQRRAHLDNNLAQSRYTDDLFIQYRKHLGAVRYRILLEVQKLIVPQQVSKHLSLPKFPMIKIVIVLYKWSRKIKADSMLRALILPAKYKREILSLDVLARQ